eukprot:scaffold103446_cov63-Phaeocystis_antarctica.AAC.1
MPGGLSCPFGGLATQGGNSIAVIDCRNGLREHEIGHNFGLSHSNAWDLDKTSKTDLTPKGSASGYGDKSCTMGANYGGHFNAPMRLNAGWMTQDPAYGVSGASLLANMPDANENVCIWSKSGKVRIRRLDIPPNDAEAPYCAMLYLAKSRSDWDRGSADNANAYGQSILSYRANEPVYREFYGLLERFQRKVHVHMDARAWGMEPVLQPRRMGGDVCKTPDEPGVACGGVLGLHETDAFATTYEGDSSYNGQYGDPSLSWACPTVACYHAVAVCDIQDSFAEVAVGATATSKEDAKADAYH